MRGSTRTRIFLGLRQTGSGRRRCSAAAAARGACTRALDGGLELFLGHAGPQLLEVLRLGCGHVARRRHRLAARRGAAIHIEDEARDGVRARARQREDADERDRHQGDAEQLRLGELEAAAARQLGHRLQIGRRLGRSGPATRRRGGPSSSGPGGPRDSRGP